MNRAVLVSGHYLGSKRKAGFHWLAESLHSKGWDVLFVTAPISWLSRLRRDHRFNYPIRQEANRICQVKDRLRSFVWYTSWHPANFRLDVLNRLSSPFVGRYGSMSLGEAEPVIADANLVIFESTPALMLFDQIRELASSASMVYRVSDDLRLLANHPQVLATEARIAAQFDLISVPCHYLRERFVNHNVHVHPHGVQKDRFDAPSASPYDDQWHKHLVFVGNDKLDRDFIIRASQQFPQWAFHIIGPVKLDAAAPNIKTYGEMAFDETVRYIKHADIGLHTLSYAPGAESFSDSLKVMQYTYCGLPIIAPDFLTCHRPHMLNYRLNDSSSIAAALQQAAEFDRSTIDRNSVQSWDDVCQSILQAVAEAPAKALRPIQPCHVAS